MILNTDVARDKYGKWKKTSEPERVRGIQAICGFLLDDVINRNREFYAGHRVSVGQLVTDRDDEED